MEIIERSQCAISGESDLEPLYDFPDFPVFMGCLDQPEEMDLKQDMSWWISRCSGLIQLKKLLPLNILYPESHGAGAVGVLWDKHHKAFAMFVSQATPSSVLEIGGAHGILEKEYQKFDNIPWTILEPNPSPVEGCRARFIKGFFDENFSYPDSFDTVIHSHLFEHIYKPGDFMSHLSGFLSDGKKLIFSLPNMQVMLERKYTNCINFEHTVFLTEPYVEFLLAQYGFMLLKKEYFMNDHSIFYMAVRCLDTKTICLSDSLYQINKNLYLEYIDYHEKLIKELNEKINKANEPIYLFGAHVFAQYLISFGLNTDRIVSLLDNDSKKHGKRLYGTNLMVESPHALTGINHPVIILKAGVYNNEIKNDILENINTSVVFWE
jgi:hypothetical protein